MNVREFANTGIQVPELAQGTWQYGAGPEPLRAGLELGACFIDTAENYGTESIVGEAISGMRERVFLASKVSPTHFRYHDVIRAAENSLQRLRTDYLDLYQLHWPNYTIPLEETMSAMERLVETGKVRFIGVSNFSVAELKRAQAALSRARISSNQVRYSLLDRSPERDLLPFCQANGVALLAYSPFSTGLKKMLEADSEDLLGQIATELGKTRAQVALNWCVSHPSVIAIFKAETIDHVRENCGASGWALSEEQRRLLGEGIRDRLTKGPLAQAAKRLARRVKQTLLQAR
jgi:diketogulonate reductase-like aldo/keto reductase